MEIILHHLTAPGVLAANIDDGVGKGRSVRRPRDELAPRRPGVPCGGARFSPSTVGQAEQQVPFRPVALFALFVLFVLFGLCWFVCCVCVCVCFVLFWFVLVCFGLVWFV